MAENYDKIDLVFTNQGDFVIGHTGDILDSSHDILRSVYQEIINRVKSSIKDWSLYPEIGASISDFVGEANTKLIAEAIKTRIKTSLTKNGFIKSKDINIKYLPADEDRLLFRITISVLPTALNKGSNTLTITTLYNYSENNVFVL